MATSLESRSCISLPLPSFSSSLKSALPVPGIVDQVSVDAFNSASAFFNTAPVAQVVQS